MGNLSNSHNVCHASRWAPQTKLSMHKDDHVPHKLDHFDYMGPASEWSSHFGTTEMAHHVDPAWMHANLSLRPSC